MDLYFKGGKVWKLPWNTSSFSIPPPGLASTAFDALPLWNLPICCYFWSLAWVSTPADDAESELDQLRPAMAAVLPGAGAKHRTDSPPVSPRVAAFLWLLWSQMVNSVALNQLGWKSLTRGRWDYQFREDIYRFHVMLPSTLADLVEQTCNLKQVISVSKLPDESCLPALFHTSAASVPLLPTFSISSLFLLRLERVILTVTELSWPRLRRAIRLGCRGLKEISSSGLGKRLVLPFSREISEDSSTDGPAEPCWRHREHTGHCWVREVIVVRRDWLELWRGGTVTDI